LISVAISIGASSSCRGFMPEYGLRFHRTDRRRKQLFSRSPAPDPVVAIPIGTGDLPDDRRRIAGNGRKQPYSRMKS